MKKAIAFSLLLLTSIVLFAQTFRPIPSNGAQFRIEYRYFDVLTPGYESATVWHQFTDGDTLIDSLTVTKIKTGPSALCYSSGGAGPMAPLVTEGYLWQDPQAGKVYYKEPGVAPELLFDFAANPGDIIPLPDALDYYPYVAEFQVMSVDTVTFADGIPRRRLQLSASGFAGDAPEWVEGIGDIKHGFLPLTSFEDAYYATCYLELELGLGQGSPPYCAMPTDCDVLLDRQAMSPDWEISLQQNPGSALMLKGIVQPVNVQVFDLQGQQLAEGKLLANGPIKGLEELANGLYLVKVQPTAGGEATTLRWVKE